MKFDNSTINHLYGRGGNIAPLWKMLIAGEVDMFQVCAVLSFWTPETVNRRFRMWCERTGR